MAGVLAAFLATGIDYPGRDKHVKDVVAYLGRMSRTKFLLDDLEEVCQFLAMLPKQQKLFDKLVRRGLKDYPDSPIFQMMGASLEIEKGPFLMRPEVARRHLDKALKLAEGVDEGRVHAPDPADQATDHGPRRIDQRPAGLPRRIRRVPLRRGRSPVDDGHVRFVRRGDEDDDDDDVR